MPPGDAWNDYWRLAPAIAAFHGDGREDPNLAGFWLRVFEGARPLRGGRPRILDFACGGGIVTGFVRRLRASTPDWQPELFAFDRAPAAAAAYRTRFTDAPVLVADAARTPYADRSFEVVASLFGAEYAGMPAVDEAARLVAPLGVFAAVVHRKHGPLYRECAADLHAIEVLRKCALLEAFAVAMQRTASSAADAALLAAQVPVEEELRISGPRVTGGALQRLLGDIVHMRRRRHAYDPDAVRDWTGRMSAELSAYAARMSAMLAAAVDAPSMEAIAARAQAQGLLVRERGALRLGAVRDEPAAWVLVCGRDP